MDETKDLKTKGTGNAYFDGILKRYDLPKDVAIEMGEGRVKDGAGKTRIYYRFTCAHCNARCGFSEPNILYDVGVCSNCGKETEITEAGFMTVEEFTPKKRKGAAHATKQKPSTEG